MPAVRFMVIARLGRDRRQVQSSVPRASHRTLRPSIPAPHMTRPPLATHWSTDWVAVPDGIASFRRPSLVIRYGYFLNTALRHFRYKSSGVSATAALTDGAPVGPGD